MDIADHFVLIEELFGDPFVEAHIGVFENQFIVSNAFSFSRISLTDSPSYNDQHHESLCDQKFYLDLVR